MSVQTTINNVLIVNYYTVKLFTDQIGENNEISRCDIVSSSILEGETAGKS